MNGNTRWVAVAGVILMVPLGCLAGGMCGAGAGCGPEAPAGGALCGTVVFTTNASRYTYVQLDTGKGLVWVAGPVTAVKSGDCVTVASSLPNKDFYSPSLKRKFDELFFADAITVGREAACGKGGATGGGGGKGSMCAAVSSSNRAAVVTVPPVAGGRTVAEIITGRKKFSGQAVVVRGLVVKVVPHILGRNFLHVRDGSGSEGSNDLVVTTEAEIKEQSTVTLRGTVVTDKDFGSGYRYDVLVEDAHVVTP
jgi:hypothetical protein